ncbi:MAG: bifunctional diguanylate cyclase/phosphodiesterase [Clostridia bacterium]|nr:bifunctional diguanylate cyclase/phosphodiesterase [Clostridia bacterium]
MERYRFDPKVFADMEASPVPFAVYQFIDKRVVTLALSEGFCRMFGYPDRAKAYDEMDNDMYRLAHPDDAARVADAAVRFATEGGTYNEIYRSKITEDDEHYIVVHAQGEHVTTATGERLAYVWYANEGLFGVDGEQENDLNRSFNRMMREDSMVRKNHYDPLTGLPNMTYFFDLAEAGLKGMLSHGKKAAVLFIDLCGMKAFNSKYGFSAGDQLILDFGHMLAAHFSSESCARFGQDHFAVFAEAEGIEEKLCGLFEKAQSLNEGDNLPVRAGIFLTDAEIEIGKACDRAKIACDLNRNAVVSCYTFFDSQMLAETENRQYIAGNLNKALSEGWIKVYYQPIVRAANGRVCDEEALSRWIDPVKGFLSPAEFIRVLEEAKLIYKLDLYVLDEILKKMKRQKAMGLYVVPTSLNLSRADFESCDIVEEIRSRVDEAGVSRSQLTIEITESVVGSDFEFIKKQITRFQELGFKVWMDDFGSGYSSLDMLQNIHFDLIKFDMRFMQQFGSGEENRVILTELVKMCMGLGVETICEGVEKKEQVEFLQEIGCTKLQGYYYCKPIPMEEVFRRYEEGLQIGFENPDESEYYATIGRINLYDMAVLSEGGDVALGRYFDTIPLAVLEVKGTRTKYVRCNKAYRDFMLRAFGKLYIGKAMDHALLPNAPGTAFLNAVIRCSREGNRIIVDEKVAENRTVHSFIRRVAVNPVTGTAAIAVAVLAVIEEDQNAGASYANIARALSSDYVYLYYVNLETEEFTEYTSDAQREDLAAERHGDNFFENSHRDAMTVLCKEDLEYFISSFTREKIIQALDTQGTFTINYRQFIDGKPTYVSMKAVRMNQDSKHIIIGVSNVDVQMREKEAMERIVAERITFSRIAALSGGYICIYAVDPETDHYLEYSATRDYEGLGLAKEGENFFEQTRKVIPQVVFKDDQAMFKARFTKENVMAEIQRCGLYVLRYRLMIDGKPQYVNVKAALVEERDGKQLIIGVNNIDAHVRAEQANK